LVFSSIQKEIKLVYNIYKMAAKILLRIASALMLIHAIGHTFGQMGWKQSTDPIQNRVIQEMTGPKFPFMGVSRSMGNYFDGYGYSVSISILVIVLILWFVSADLRSNTLLIKKIIFMVSLSLTATGIDELIFFFPFAACTTLLASSCGFISFYLLLKQSKT
jgi:hypothetical protein